MSHRRRKKQQPHKPPGKQPFPPAKIQTWTLPTVLALIIGIVGAVGVFELRPQVRVFPQEPIEKSQPFSVPFRIENTGYFSWWLEHTFCYYNEVKFGNSAFYESGSHSDESDRHAIDRSEAETISCKLSNSPVIPTTADIAIVIDYRPWQRFPWTFRRYFRFKGAYVDNWQWLSQPSEEIRKNADALIEKHMK